MGGALRARLICQTSQIRLPSRAAIHTPAPSALCWLTSRTKGPAIAAPHTAVYAHPCQVMGVSPQPIFLSRNHWGLPNIAAAPRKLRETGVREAIRRSGENLSG